MSQSAEKIARELADIRRRLGGVERTGQISRSTITIDGETFRLPAAVESGVQAGKDLPVVKEGLTALEIAQEELAAAHAEREERLEQAETDLAASAERLEQAEAHLDEVFGTAGAAATAAAAAQTTADAAKTAASSAQSTANTAKTDASTAKSAADAAQARADAVLIEAKKNTLVINGGLEEAGTFGSAYRQVTAESRSGTACAVFGANQWRSINWNTVPATPGQTFEVRLWVKKSGDTGTVIPSVAFDIYDASGAEIGTDVYATNPPTDLPTATWSERIFRLGPIPAGVASVRLRTTVTGSTFGTGTVYLDDVWMNDASAMKSAEAAQAAADAAKTAAATAQTKADQAATAAANAQSVANVASGKADDAKAAATTAQTTADSAKTDAATAKTNASNAAEAASAAQSTADTAKTDAAAAAGIANGKGDVLIQSTTPVAAMRKATTLWIDTTGNLNAPKRWNATTSTWTVVTDKAATDAASAAATAQSTANTAKTDAATAKSAADAAASAASAAQTRADAAHSLAGTAESNAQSAISSAAGAQSAASAAQSTADTAKSDAASAAGIASGKADVLIQSTTPATSMRKATTLWIDTTGNLNAPKRWNGTTSTWTVVTDKAATDAATAAASAQSTADAAKTAAAAAQQSADNASKNLFSTALPSGVAPFGSTWFRVNGTGEVIGQWQQTATGIASTWTSRPIRSEVIANLDVGKLTAGTANIIDAVAQKIAAGTATIQTADIANLYATSSTMDSAVAQKIFTAKLSAGKILAEEVLIGAGFNLIPNGRGEQGDASGWASPLTFDTADAPTGLPGSFVGPNSTKTIQAGTNKWAVEPDTYYTFEIYLKADKPNSVFYMEFRDQNSAHGTTNGPIPGELYAGSGGYPVGALTVPTTWTRYKGRVKTRSDTQTLRIGGMYFNHSAGTEKTAVQRIAGMSLMRGIDAALVVDGAIDGKVITGATIRTAATGARVQQDEQGLRAFDSSNRETVRISAADGTLMATGALSSYGEGKDFFTGVRSSIKATLGNKMAQNSWVGYDFLQPGVYFERDSGTAQPLIETPRVVSPRAADVEMVSAQVPLNSAKPNEISQGSVSAGPGYSSMGSKRYNKTLNADGGNGFSGVLTHCGILTNEDAIVSYVEDTATGYAGQYSLSIGGRNTVGTGAVVPTPPGVQLKYQSGPDDPAPSDALVRIDRAGVLDIQAKKGSALARMYATGDGKLRLSGTGGVALESAATATSLTATGTVQGATVKATGALQGASAAITGNVQAATLNGEPITFADMTATAPTYATNYGPYAGFQAPAYYRDSSRVWLMGLLGTTVTTITLAAGQVYQVATIPAAYAPAQDILFSPVLGPQMDQRTFLYVRASGSIEYYSPASISLSKTNFYIGLEGISWLRKS